MTGQPVRSSPSIRVVDAIGDLLETPAEALVNPWNRNFVPRVLLWPHGVSGELKKRTGRDPWQQLARMGVLDHGAAVATGVGRMAGPKHLIHVAGLNTWWKATPAGVEDCARNAVAVAGELAVSSLAMPLIGAGVGGLSPEESRQAIQAGLATYDQPGGDVQVDLEVILVTMIRAAD